MNINVGFYRIAMKNLLIALLLLISLVACGSPGEETATESASQTPDPCAEANLPAEVDKVHKITREFDDYSALASNTPQSQLVQVIPELQRVLRDAEDQPVPSCLSDLKALQIRHMNTVVQTLLLFVSSGDVNIVGQGIAQARELHAQYDLEMARLLGVTLNVVTATPPGATETTATPQAQVTQPPTPEPVVTNNGSNDLNLRVAPDFNAAPTNVLAVGQSTPAIGRTADAQWILVQVPDQPGKNAWVYASVVQLSVSIETLPVAAP
jgi:hypothetical protein